MVVEAFEVLGVLEGALDEGFGGGGAVLVEEVFLEGAAVDADAHGDAAGFEGGDDLGECVGVADVARVEADGVDAGLHGGYGEAVVEVDVGDDGEDLGAAESAEGVDGFGVGEGGAEDVATGFAGRFGLADEGVGIVGGGGAHGLDADGRAASDGYAADADLSGFLPCHR